MDDDGNYVTTAPTTRLESECNRVQGKVEERQTASGEVYIPRARSFCRATQAMRSFFQASDVRRLSQMQASLWYIRAW